MLGFKQLAWRSVLIPPVMPKPDVVALTGGYRKTPILQIGADVYCDTALIARVLEARQPQPTLYPADRTAGRAAGAVGRRHAVRRCGQLGDAAGGRGRDPGHAAARGAEGLCRRPRRDPRRHAPRPTLADATAQLKQHLSAIAAQLQQGGPWLFGAAPSIADFSVGALPVVHPPGAAGGRPAGRLSADRSLARPAVRHRSSPRHPAEQRRGAGRAPPGATTHAPALVEPGQGFEAGQAVTVAATDYGIDPVAGTLVGLSRDEVGAAPHRRARRHGARALPALRFPAQGRQDMKQFRGRTAVITGAASGFGLEASRIAAREGMNVVMADVQADALDRAAAEIAARSARRCCRSGSTSRRRPRSRRWPRPRCSASARRTSSSTTPASAPAA